MSGDDQLENMPLVTPGDQAATTPDIRMADKVDIGTPSNENPQPDNSQSDD